MTDPEKLAMAAEIVTLRGAIQVMLNAYDGHATQWGKAIGTLEKVLSLPLPPLVAAVQDCLEKAKTMRHYCLGSDASTENMLAEYDAALSALDAAMGKK